MKIVETSTKEIFDNDPMKHIESIGRICYKSENNITGDSSAAFVKRMCENKHHAMLEHFRFIVIVSKDIYDTIRSVNCPYINGTMTKLNNGETRYIISSSARGFLEALHSVDCDMEYNPITRYTHKHVVALLSVIKHIVYEYDCEALFEGWTGCQQSDIECVKSTESLSYIEYMIHGWHSVKFVCDRGVSHELVRHRSASFAQESTRYCNYSQDKFGNEVSFIKPSSLLENDGNHQLWLAACWHSEAMYLKMLEYGSTPQEARSVLPNSLKTEIIVTATNAQWQHMIELRYIGTTGKPHPDMRRSMELLINNHNWAYNLYVLASNNI